MQSIDKDENQSPSSLTKINSAASLSGKLIYNYHEGYENIFHNKDMLINNI
jgi:hypothetical protein